MRNRLIQYATAGHFAKEKSRAMIKTLMSIAVLIGSCDEVKFS